MKKGFFFDHAKIEKYWAQQWLQRKTYRFNPLSSKKPYYVLDMFLYPSGSGLHVGHARGYTATDIIARMKKMQGYEVCHPIGWDAFGLPAEQYAIKHNIHPKEAIENNINVFRRQLRELGFSYDYSLEINTSDPSFLAETQKMFQFLLIKNYAYKTFHKHNWSEDLQTGLANEETYFSDGQLLTKIGNHPVIQQYQSQWVVEITKFARELDNGLEKIAWPQSIINQQKKWIGRQVVFAHTCKINGIVTEIIFEQEHAKEYFGLFLAPGSNILDTLRLHRLRKLQITKLRQQSELQKAQEAPVIINLKCWITIQNQRIPLFCCSKFSDSQRNQLWMVFDNSQVVRNFPKIFEQKKFSKVRFLVNHNSIVRKEIFKIHDWVFSRQRFWGEPFPIFYDSDKKLHLEKKLPLTLPPLTEPFSIIGMSKFPLKKIENWFKFQKDGKTFFRDPNVMPQWAGSSWYYIGYLWQSARNIYGSETALRDPRTLKIINKFLPVNLYIGGKEHAVLHLIYSRFWHKVLQQSGIVKCDEPFYRFFAQGLILGKNNQKMSKSRGNVLTPDKIITEYGADALRCYEMFVSPLAKDFRWEGAALHGIRKWLDRFAKMYSLITNISITSLTTADKIFYSEKIEGIKHDYSHLQFNTAISKFMIVTNYCYRNQLFPKHYLKDILLLFSCICPFISEELWAKYYFSRVSIYHANWPKHRDTKQTQVPIIKIIVQQNHRFRFVCEWEYQKLKSRSDMLAVILLAVKKHQNYRQSEAQYKSKKPFLYCANKFSYVLNFK